MPHGVAGPGPGAAHHTFRLPGGLSLLDARFERHGNDLLIVTAGRRLLIADFFATARPPDLEQADGVRLSGRLIAQLAASGEIPTAWVADLADGGHGDSEALTQGGEGPTVAGDGGAPADVAPATERPVAGAERPLGDLEVSAGGDEDALSGDAIAVTRPLAPFDLKPGSLTYGGAARDDTVIASRSVELPDRGEESFLLFTSFSDEISLPPPREVTRWDNGRRWEAIGTFSEVSGSEPEAPLESGRLITARDGFMARLEADVTVSTDQIAKFLDVDGAALRAVVADARPASGTAMRMASPISLKKGEQIHFEVFFDGASQLPFNDFAVMTVRLGTATHVVPISSIADLEAAGRGGSGWLTLSYTAGTAGSYRFGFAVLNDNDASPSRLYVDNVRRDGPAPFPLETMYAVEDGFGGSVAFARPLPRFAEPLLQVQLAPNETLTLNALANVIDPDGYDAPRLFGIDRSGTIGAVHAGSDGLITYAPANFYRSLAAGESGRDRFTYLVDGGNGALGWASVEIRLTVLGVNDAPTARDDAATVDLGVLARVGAPQPIAVLLNDDDVDSDDDASSLRIVSATAASGAEVTIARIADAVSFGLLYDPRALPAAQRLSLGETLVDADTISYRIADRWGATAEARVAITWIGANDAPTANDDVAVIGEDEGPAVVAVLANDDDIDGDDDALSLRLVAAKAERGTATILPDGRLLIDHGGGFDALALGERARYTVSYTIEDRHGARADGRVTVTVVGANDAPVAKDDIAEAVEDGPPVLIDVLANDDDVDSDDNSATLRVIAAESARGARVSTAADGRLVYDLAGVAAFDRLREGEVAVAFDTVTYRISDRHGAEATGRVAVTVTGRNDPLDARDDLFVDDGFGRPLAVTEDRVDPLPVLANDLDSDDGDTKTVIAVNGIAVAVGGPPVMLPSGASVRLLASGELGYDPGGQFDWLSVGETAIETFTYTAADGSGSTDTATVTLVLRGLNDPPVAVDDFATTDEETPIRIAALANDYDPDRRDVITLTGSDLASELFAIGADGAVVFDPRGRLDWLSVGEAETFTLRYEISDPHGAQASARVFVTVHGVNDAPIAGNDEFLVFADRGVAATAGVSLLDNDRDPDALDRLTVAAVNGDGAAVGRPIALPAGGLLTVFADGTFAYDPLGRFDGLGRDELTRLTFTYTVVDGHGGSDEATVSLILRGVNDAPIARPDFATVIEDGPPVLVDVLANDFDPDGPDETASLRLIAATSANGASVRVSPGQRLVYETLGAFDWLALGETAIDDVFYTVRDRHGAEAIGHLKVTVTGTNDAPTAVTDVATVHADGVVTIDARANDFDVDSDDDATTLRLIAATTAWGEPVAITADGQLAFDAKAVAAFRALGEGAVRTFDDAIVYTIADRHGAAAVGTVRLTVIGVNDPIRAGDDAFTIGEDDTARLVVDANDIDPDLGDSKRILAINGAPVGVGVPLTLASGATVTVLADNRLEFTPGPAFNRLGAGATAVETLTYTIADGHGSQDTATVTIAITGANDLPIAGDDVATTVFDKAMRIDVLANDVDPDEGDVLRVRTILDEARGANGEVFVDGDGHVVFDPAGRFDDLRPGETRTVSFRYIVEDRQGGEAEGRLTVTVSGGNRPPVAGDDAFVVPADRPTLPDAGRSVLSTDRAADGQPLAVVAVNGDTNAVGRPLDLADSGRLTLFANGTFAFAPLGAFDPLALYETRALTFTYTVADGLGASAEARVTLTVVGANEPPVARADTTVAFEAGPPVRIDVLANDDDIDSDDDASTLRLLGAVAGFGEVTLTADRALLYTAGAAFAGLAEGEIGSDEILYRIADRHGAEAIGRVAVTVHGRNDAPIAREDFAAVMEDGPPIRIAVRANDDDVDADDDATTLRIVEAASHVGGRVQIEADGTLSFDPAGAFDALAAGEVRTFVNAITYVIEDRHGARASAGVTLTVTGVNDVPLANPDTLIVRADAVRSAPLAVLANDVDADDDALRVVGIDGRPLAAGEVAVLASGARVRIEGAGLLLYEPDGRYRHLAEGEQASEIFSYRVDDGAGGFADGRVTVTILGVNDAPTASADAAAMMADEVTRIAVLTNDDDVDSDDDATTLKLVAATSHVGGAVTLGADGTLTFDGRGIAAFAELAAGHSRTFVGALSYWIEDRHGARAEGRVDLTVTGVNDPIIAVDDAFAVFEHEARPLAVLANDLDPDFDDSKQVIAINGAPVAVGETLLLPSGARLTLLADGRLLYDANGQFGFLGAGETAIDRFTYVVADGHGSRDEASVTVTVNGRNSAPIAADDWATTDADVAVRIFALANDVDPDARDVLRIRTLVAGSAAVDGIAVGDIAALGDVRINSDGSLTFDPAGRFDDLMPGEARTISFQYLVEDNHGADAVASAFVRIVGVAQPSARGQELIASFEESDPRLANSAFAGWAHLPTRATGDLAVSGLADFTGELVVFAAPHLGRVAQLTAAGSAPAALAALLDVPTAELPRDTDGTRVNGGTAMALTLAVPPTASTIAFDWNFLSAEDAAVSGINDVAVFTVSDGTISRVFTLADARGVGAGASGWRTSIFDLGALFPAAGETVLRLGFAVLDDQTPDNPSRLLVDNVRLDRGLGADYTLLATDGALTTWRQNPTARDDGKPAAITDEDTALTIAAADLLANDLVSRGAAVASRRIVEVTTLSGRGLATVTADGIRFDPAGAHDDLAEGDVRTETLLYTLTDANGGRDVARLTVRLEGRNDTPIAGDDLVTLDEDGPVAIPIASLLANDRDPDAGDVLSFVGVDGSGLLGRIRFDGLVLTYDPAGRFEHLPLGGSAVETVVYTVRDRLGAEGKGTVSLRVEGRNDAPVAVDDAFEVAADRPYLGRRTDLSVLANDGDPDLGDRLTVLSVAGQPVGVPVALAGGGVLTLDADGTFDFDPAGAFDRLAAGVRATLTVPYTIGDGHGATATATLTLTVIGVNDPPVGVPDAVTTDEDSSLVIAVLANDHDPDDGDRLHIAAVDTSGLAGRVTINADQTLTYDPRGAFDGLPAGAVAEEAFFYTVRDAAGATASARVTVRIVGINDGILAVDDLVAADEDLPTALDILANDIDPDRGDGRRIVAINGTAAATGERIALPSGAFLVLLADGRVLYEAAGAFEALGRDESAVDRFTYTVADDAGATSSANVAVTVVGRNDAPAAAADAVATDANAMVRIAVLANDRDVDANDVLRVIGVDAVRAFGTVRINGDGTLTYDPAGKFAGLAAGETATDSFTYTIADGKGGEATARVTVTIHGIGAPDANRQQLLSSFETLRGEGGVAVFPEWTQEPTTATGSAAIARLGDFGGRLAPFEPTHLDHVGLLRLHGGNVHGIADLLQLPAGSVDGTRGAAVASRISLGPFDAGSDGRITLSFDWNFIGAEAANPAALTDRALFSISDGTGVDEPGRWFLFTLADMADIAGGEGGASGWRTSVFDVSAAFVVPPSGLFLTLGFAVVGASDIAGPSQLLLDNVRLNRTLTPDYELVGSSADDTFATYRQRPTAIDDGLRASVAEDGEVLIAGASLLANDVAGRGAAPGSQRLVAVEAVSGRGLASVVGGDIRFVAAGAFDHLAEGDEVIETLRYTLTDANGGHDTASFQVLIRGVNDAPVAATIAVATDEDSAVAIDIADILARAWDADAGDVLRFVGVEGAALKGQVSLEAGSVRYDPGAAFQGLATGQSATETIRYEIADRLGARGTGTITVTITGRNDAPIAVDDAFDVAEDGTTFLPVLANDADIDGDRLAITAIDGFAVPADGRYRLPSGAVLIVDPRVGLTFDAAGRYEWLAAGEVRNERFTYTVGDGNGAFATATVTLTVRGANDAPVARNDRAVTDEDAMVRIAVLANDTDDDVTDRLSVVAVETEGTRGAVRLAADGTLIYDPAGRFDDLLAGQWVTDSFRYWVSDTQGARSSASVTVTIHGVGTVQSHPQQLLTSFEIPWQQAGPGWQAEPFAAGEASPVRLTTAFAADFGTALTIRDDLKPWFDRFTPTHLELAAQLAAFGSSGFGPGSVPSAIETFLAVPGGALPDDNGAFSGERGDGSEANAGAAMRTHVALSAADVGADGRLTLSFDWNFFSAETVADNAPGSNDFAAFSISDGSTWRLFTLADARTTGFGASGWRTSVFDISAVFTLPAAGALDLVIGFAVVNDQTPHNPSFLLVDNVRFNREIGTDYELVGASAGNLLRTYRQNPTAFDDAPAAAATDEDTPILIALADLLGNDAPSRGAAAVSVSAVARLLDGVTGEPTGGQVSLIDRDGDGIPDAVLYDPRGVFERLAEGVVHHDHFRYRITDGNGGSDEALVMVRVEGRNDAPVAAADVIAGLEDQPIVGNVLADNGFGADRDVDGDALFVDPLPLAGPRHGTLTLNRDGSFIYRPDPDFHGVDSFTYRVADRPAGGLADTATVQLIVAPVNDPPVAGDDVARTDEDSTITIDVLANDRDVDAGDVLRPVAIAGLAVAAGQRVTLASGAVVTLNADGTLGYDPRPAFAWLRPGEQASETFTYTVGDGQGGRADGRVTVTIDGRNDLPVAGTDLFFTTAGLGFTVAAAQLLLNDSDADRGDPLRVTAVDAGGALGAVTFDGTTLSYDPLDRFRALGVGESAVDIFRYRVADSFGGESEGEIRVTVAGVNDPPQAIADFATTARTRPVIIDVLANDRDPDQNDRLSIIDFDTTGTRGQVSLNADGTVTYDPRGGFDDLGAGQVATDRFRYTIVDSAGARDTAEVTVTVSGRNASERLVDSFEQPIDIRNISFGASDSVQIRTAHAETDGARGTFAPTDGSHLAWLEAYGSTRSTLDAFLGINLRAHFTDIDGSSPVSGAAFRLAVMLEEGDELSFDWMFDARDRVSGSPADNDFALITLTDSGGTDVFKLSDVRATGDYGATGWRSTIYTADQTGPVTIAFGVVNDRASDMPSVLNPASENSMLLVDNLRINRDFSAGYQVVEASADGKFETVVAQHV